MAWAARLQPGLSAGTCARPLTPLTIAPTLTPAASCAPVYPAGQALARRCWRALWRVRPACLSTPSPAQVRPPCCAFLRCAVLRCAALLLRSLDLPVARVCGPACSSVDLSRPRLLETRPTAVYCRLRSIYLGRAPTSAPPLYPPLPLPPCPVLSRIYGDVCRSRSLARSGHVHQGQGEREREGEREIPDLTPAPLCHQPRCATIQPSSQCQAFAAVQATLAAWVGIP